MPKDPQKRLRVGLLEKKRLQIEGLSLGCAAIEINLNFLAESTPGRGGRK